MRRSLVLTLTAAALVATAPGVLAHDSQIAYVCTKVDGDHIFLTANHAATHGLSTSIAATAEINLEHFGAVCRIVE